ncbi:MAG TPA: DUF421 domain-containing protein [Oscillospiraceae bacterium]|nr:DUF421 domain-containing protein [Oscillospiraceae bacterium]
MPAWLMVLLRSSVLFVLVFFFIRVLGTKHPAKMTPFRFVNYAVIAVIIGLLASTAIDSFILGLAALSVWLVMPFVLDYLELRSKAVHDLLEGKEAIIIKQGKIMEENLKRARLTGEELLRDLRAKNIFSISDVEFAVLEANGELNVMLKSDQQPLTAHDLAWQVTPQTEPQTVILDGNILNDPLTELGLNSDWLQTELVKAGVSLDNVFLGQVNSVGELYIDLFNDAIKVENPSVRQALFATLEKAQADLTSFSLETQQEQAKAMFARNAADLQSVLDGLRPHLLR